MGTETPTQNTDARPVRERPPVEPIPEGAATEISPTCMADPVMGCTPGEQILITWLDRNASKGNKFVSDEMWETYKTIRKNNGNPVEGDESLNSGELPTTDEMLRLLEKNPEFAAIAFVTVSLAAVALVISLSGKRRGYGNDDLGPDPVGRIRGEPILIRR